MTTDKLPDGTRDTSALAQAKRLAKLQAIVDGRVRMAYDTVQAMREHPAFFRPVERKAPRRGC